MKYKFVAYHEDGSKTIKTSKSVYLGDLIVAFNDFLKGCGFAFDGQLYIIDEERKEEKNEK